MLYRIQTLFLIIVTGILASMFFCPMIKFIGSQETITYVEYYPTLILLLVSTVLTIATLANYKKPFIQTRICIINTIILLGFQGFIAYQYFNLEEGMTMSLTAVFPIVAAILTYIAMKFCARDFAILVASSRLRSRRRK